MTTLIASRYYAQEYEWQKQHHWGKDHQKMGSVTDWVGKTVGIAGYGSIGRQGGSRSASVVFVCASLSSLYPLSLFRPFFEPQHDLSCSLDLTT